MKIFKNKKTRLIAILSTNLAVLSAALVISTISWFNQSTTIDPPNDVPSSILSSYFDRIGGIDETLYPHGSAANPYVITRPIHYYNLVRLHELGTYGFDNNTYFQFGKLNIDDSGNTTPLFYNYSDNGVIQDGYTPYLNMKYYSNENALAPIGSARHPFEGHIIGNNLTVQNLHIKGGGYSDIGIFGYVASNASVNNLYFDAPEIDAANASAIAPGSIGHAAHESHVYIGYLAGHVYNPQVFYHVYLNNCKLYNTVGNAYEMINTYGYFGHTDEPLESTADSSSYTSQLIAPNAYDALAYTYATGASDPLARRYTSEVASGNFSGSVSKTSSSYTIGQKDSSGTKPYSLSSIGYSSGDAGTSKYVRFVKNVAGEERYETIANVEPQNVLNEKPVYIEYPEDENEEPINHGNDPEYDFYGYNDGDYIFYDETDPNNPKWRYAEVSADLTQPAQGAVTLNCFTIFYQQTVSGTTKTYYLKYQEGSGSAYDTLVPQEWTSNTPPQDEEYYFAFKTTFGSTGVSRFTECSVEAEYYIYSPVGQSYVCTYAPQNVHNTGDPLEAHLVHTPIFVPEDGLTPPGKTKKAMPTLFTVGGPNTYITYDAVDNKYTGDSRNVNNDFADNVGRTATPVKGALQGSNITNEFGTFGGHKMTANCPGGQFTIGEFIENQTTTLNNAVNYKLTSASSDIVENSTLVIAGFKGEQTSTASIDYAMATQSTNNRLVKTVEEVRDSSGYVLNETTGVAKLTVNYVGRDPEDNKQIFTLYSDGYLTYPGKVEGVSGLFTGAGGNKLRTYDYDYLHEDGKSERIAFSQWKYAPFEQYGYYTRYRFQNVGDPDRYLCYNVWSNIFACYSLSEYQTEYNAEEFSNNNVDLDPNTENPNVRCWFYIYKQQYGQTIQNVHFTVARTIDIEGTVYPFKNVLYYDLLASDINNSPTDYDKYAIFTVNPSKNVYFNSTTSQVQYFDSLVEVWKRVSIISELRSGDRVMIGAQTSTGTTPTHYFMSTTQSYNYRNRSSSVRFTPPYVPAEDVPSNAQVFTLVKSDLGWRFDTGSGFIYAASSSSNYLRTESSPDANGNADFAISILGNGNANIIAQGNNTRNRIQYYAQSSWWGGGSGYFSCFNSSQTAVQLYKLAQSSADRATFVGDLINNFEPLRMDVVGPNVTYYEEYFQMGSAPSVITTPEIGNNFYPSINFKNAITILIDNNGSRDLGTLTFKCTSSNNSVPYFKLPDGTTTSLVDAGAVDTSATSEHNYLLNLNALNIDDLCYSYIKGVGDVVEPFKFCESTDEDLSKFLIVLGASSNVHITEVTFTFNAVPGNIGYAGTVDYRTATYDANGVYQGSVANGQMVEFSALSVYYDVTNTGQLVGVNVTYSGGTYTVTVDSTRTVLTADLIINIFKYDNNASTLVVVVNGVSTTYYTGTVSITVPATT